MVESYWLIGQSIVEHEQHGEVRADYEKGVLKELAERLTREFGKGFDESNLRYMRLFYRNFPIRDTLRHELTWSHYRRLISIENVSWHGRSGCATTTMTSMSIWYSTTAS